MRYLLDSHILIWGRSAPGKLSEKGVEILQSADNELYVSIATLWECAIKSSIGKLRVPARFCRIVANDYRVLGMEIPHLEAYFNLPKHHRDPFERMLIAQAQVSGLVLLTHDRKFGLYDVPTAFN